MKKAVIFIWREVWWFLWALFHWLGWKAIYDDFQYNGIEFKYWVRFRARWYSPIFWVVCLLILIMCIFKGGLIAWFRQIRNDLTEGGKWHRETNQNQFKGSIGEGRKSYLLWRMAYSNHIG